MSARRDAVLELAARYDYESAHAHQVECLAGTLFIELESLHALEPEDRSLLEYAAVLHDIGRYVSGAAHHLHTLQMIMMEPLAPFSREDKTVIANIARYHRKVMPATRHTAFGILSESAQERVALMAPLLRIADALDHSRRSAVCELACEITDNSVTLLIGSELDLKDECVALARRGDMFQQVYQRELRLHVSPPRFVETDQER